MGRSFSFALIAGTLFTVVIVINIIASSNLKSMDDDDHMHTGGGTAQPNIVLFIGSGLGPAGITLARGFQAALRKGDATPPASLSFEPYLTATLRTRSSDSIVTDAAAAASALATGKKTANGMAAVDPQTKASVLSVFEKAKQAGLKTGFITTGELAGPVAAAFTSHMEHANMAEMVASHQFAAKIDLLLGGGAKAYNTTAWTDAAYDVLKTSQDLEKASKLPVLGLFADSKLRFEIDAKTAADQPSLQKMTKKALDLLHNDKGFLLVVQAANIEACAQGHDAACLAREVLALQESYEAVAELVAKKNTICLIASDRDVGGPALVDDKLAILTPLVYSTEAMAAGILKAVSSSSLSNPLITEVIRNLTGIALNDDEASDIASANEDELASAIGNVLAKRAGLVWSSAYNTAGDVNLYTCGDATNDVPRGNVDNTVVGDYLMKKLTSSMHAASPSPMAHSGGHHH